MFAAAARDPNAKVTDWFKLGDVRAEMPKAASTVERLCLSCANGTSERGGVGITHG